MVGNSVESGGASVLACSPENMGLDGVEIVLAVEEEFGVPISDAEAESLRTPGMIIDYICSTVLDPSAVGVRNTDGVLRCSTQRAFYRIRKAILESTTSRRSALLPETELRTLFKGKGGRKEWNRFRQSLCLGSFLYPSGLLAQAFPAKTVDDLIIRLQAREPYFLRERGNWSREEVELRVRDIISEQLGIADFSNDDDLIRDLGAG